MSKIFLAHKIKSSAEGIIFIKKKFFHKTSRVVQACEICCCCFPKEGWQDLNFPSASIIDINKER